MATNDFNNRDRVARIPSQKNDGWMAELEHDGSNCESSLQYYTQQPTATRTTRKMPVSNSFRSRRQNHCSPIVCSPRRKVSPAEDFPVQSVFLLPPPPLTQSVPDRKLSPSELASLRQDVGSSLSTRPSRRLLPRSMISGNACAGRSAAAAAAASPATTSTTTGIDLKVYHDEADFLIQNQQHFTNEDFTAVLAALAEESKIDETRKRGERASIKLAQSLVSSDIEDSPPRKRASSKDDLAALVVALRAEVDETNTKKRDEEESFRVACLLVEEDVEAGAPLSNNDSCCEEEKKEEFCTPCDIQCQACHFDIEHEESVRELQCGHVFHAFCINRYWLLMKKDNCPYCRRVVKQFKYRS